MALVDQYTKEELESIVKNSSSLREVIRKVGYSTVSGSNNATVKKRLEQFNIPYQDIFSATLNKEKRTVENVFVENSTASQQTLRRWFIKGNYQPYKCSICQLEPVWQGKELTLILDHINGNNTDDRLENLRWVCPNCNQQLETTGYKKMRVTSKQTNEQANKQVKKYYCIDCGKEISKTGIRCVECSNKMRIKPLDELPVTREELKALIRTQPFTTIATKYNVSDNAIRKWCDKFNLPRKKTDINKLSDKEWEVI